MLSDEESKNLLKQFHIISNRHILIIETDMSSSDVQKDVALSNRIRKAGNELVSLMRNKFGQLIVQKSIASCLNFMVLHRINKNAKI